MVALVFAEFLSRAKTGGTYVNPVAWFAYWVCTFDSDGVCQVAIATIALYLKTRLINGCVRAFT